LQKTGARRTAQGARLTSPNEGQLEGGPGAGPFAPSRPSIIKNSMIQTLFGSLDEEPKKPGLLDRMKQAVTRTRENLSERIEEVVSFSKEIDRNTLDDLEATLIAADLGSATTQEVL